MRDLASYSQALIEELEPTERAEVAHYLSALAPLMETGKQAPADPLERVRLLWPQHFSKPFAGHHVEFWRDVDGVRLMDKPQAAVYAWSRGGAKTTSLEVAAADLGCRGRRKYILYVRRTQDRADDAVGNVAALLEAPSVAEYYPSHAQRYVGKFGRPGAWRRNRVRTAGGFTVDALGLDTAARGVKIEAQRPDAIFFDDIDEKLDGPHITAKKLDIIKHTILPTGASNVWIVFVQNLVLRDGIAAQLTDGRADFLLNRKGSGPVPAIEGLRWQWVASPATGIRRAVITDGQATWAGQDLGVCQQQIDDWGISAFLREAQHAVKTRVEGVALRFEPGHRVQLTHDQATAIVGMGRVFGGMDFGAWRFAFTLWAVDREGLVYRLDEYFAQRLPGQQSISDRARAVHELCADYGLADRMVPVWGDSANPTDIHEFNLAMRRGWETEVDDDEGHRKTVHIVSKLRILAVAQAKKARKTSVDRINDLLDRRQLRFCALAPYEWRHGMTAENPEGTILTGSRLEWEMERWSFPVPVPGEVQHQDPDDETADGADMVASMRYAVMSAQALIPALKERDFGRYEDDRAKPIEYERQRIGEPPHAVDELLEVRRRVEAPRLRGGPR